MLFQWFAMSGYWGYVIYTIGRSVYDTADPSSAAFRQAVLTNGEMAAFYNGVAFVAAFAMVPAARRIGAGPLHAIALAAGGVSMLILPGITDKAMLFAAVIGIGVAWGSIMGNPYIILAGSIPAERTGVYMGIFNFTIAAPQIVSGLVAGQILKYVFHNEAIYIVMLAGVFMILGALSVYFVQDNNATSDAAPVPQGH